MASPMRKKRAWSTRENDAESKETAAFEATVAAAQDTAAKSGAFLSTAKSDLTDHQRWLQAQSVAVERDRARHERWLQRQREHRLALARKDRARRRRQLMRQRAFRAMQAAAFASLLFVRSLIFLAFAKTAAGLKSIGALIARGAAYLGRLIAAGAQWTARRDADALARLIAAGARWTGAKLRACALIGRSRLGWRGAAPRLHVFAYLVGTERSQRGRRSWRPRPASSGGRRADRSGAGFRPPPPEARRLRTQQAAPRRAGSRASARRPRLLGRQASGSLQQGIGGARRGAPRLHPRSTCAWPSSGGRRSAMRARRRRVPKGCSSGPRYRRAPAGVPRHHRPSSRFTDRTATASRSSAMRPTIPGCQPLSRRRKPLSLRCRPPKSPKFTARSMKGSGWRACRPTSLGCPSLR